MPVQDQLRERDRKILEEAVSPPKTNPPELARRYDLSATRIRHILADNGLDGETRREIEYEEPMAYDPEHPRADSRGFVPRRIRVAEDILQRPLRQEEIVRVRDGDPLRVVPQNLEVTTRQDEAGRILSVIDAEKKAETSRQAAPADLIDGLRWLALRIGRTPRAVDINSRLPYSHATYYSVFGTLTEAQRAAGLKPNKRGGQLEAPEPPAGFREEWGWLAGYTDPKQALEAARERRHE